MEVTFWNLQSVNHEQQLVSTRSLRILREPWGAEREVQLSCCSRGLLSPNPRHDGPFPPWCHPALSQWLLPPPLCPGPCLVHQAGPPLPPTRCPSRQAGTPLLGRQIWGHLVSHGLAWKASGRLSPGRLWRLTGIPFNGLYVATMISTACIPRSCEEGQGCRGGWVLLQTRLFLESHLSAPGAVAGRWTGAVVALLHHWLVPQCAPPPSKWPLVSNCQPATVSGPAPPLVGATVAPPPPSYIKGAQLAGTKVIFWDASLPSSQSASFQLKLND